MAGQFSDQAKAAMAKSMDDVTADPNKIPGCVAVVVDRFGRTLFSHASGKRGLDSNEPMTLENVFWIASCTKMIGGIAAMQLNEQGKLGLDDADAVERIAPELKTVRILKSVENGKIETVDKKTRITMRMLLTHTAGFEYTFFSEKINAFGQPAGLDEFDAHHSMLNIPLSFEPGTDWSYGIGIDWAGTIIERLSGMTLNEYFQTHIFAPLGIHHLTMFPTPQMRHQLAMMHQKTTTPQGTHIRSRDHLYRRPLIITGKEVDQVYNSAGAGCFGRPTDYCKIITTLLNDGLCPTTHTRILTKPSVDEMFRNQIPQFPNFGRRPIAAVKPTLTNPIPMLYPQPPEQPQGWGLTFMITVHEGATGRGKNTGWWAGLPNLFWWADRENGVGGMIASQILPFGDADVMGLWANIESQVYAAREASKEGAGANGGVGAGTGAPVPVRQMTGGDHAHGSMDGYQQEFVANIER